jgi:hypothetical protein
MKMGASKSRLFLLTLGILAVVALVAGCSSQTQMASGSSNGAVAASDDAGTTSLAAGDSFGRMMFTPVATEAAPVVASDE